MTLSLASTPGNRFVIPRSSSRGASAIARDPTRTAGGRSPAPARQPCARTAVVGEIRGSSLPDADRAAGRAEHEILAAVVDAVDGVADDLGRRDVRQHEVREPQTGMVLLVRARDRRARAQAAVRHHDRGAARERSERRLLARGRAVRRPGAQHDGAGDDVVDAADERRRERPLLRPDPGDPRAARRSLPPRRARRRRPPRRAASSSRKHEPGEVRQAAAPSRARRRARSGRPDAAARRRARALRRGLRAATTTSGSPATCASVPCSITAPGTCTDERPDDADAQALPAARASPWRRVVVVAAARFPPPQPPSAQASTSRAAAVRIPQRKQNGASLAARPVRDSTCEVGLLDRRRDALDLAGLQQRELRCDRRLDRRRRPSSSTCRSRRRSTLAPKMALVPPFERAVLRAGDRGVHGDVDLLQRARHDPRAEVALVGVDADAEDALLRAPRRGRRGRTGRRPGTRRPSPGRSGSAPSPCTSPVRRSPGSSR